MLSRSLIRGKDPKAFGLLLGLSSLQHFEAARREINRALLIRFRRVHEEPARLPQNICPRAPHDLIGSHRGLESHLEKIRGIPAPAHVAHELALVILFMLAGL